MSSRSTILNSSKPLIYTSQYDEFLLRILHSCDFDFKASLNLVKKNFVSIRKAYENPIIFNERSQRLIEEGLVYIYGRDFRLRPIIIINIKRVFYSLNNKRMDDHMLKVLILKVISYAEEKLLVQGRVETFIVIADFNKLEYRYSKAVI